MDSLTHFHSRNVYFYTHFSNNLKVTALDMFHKNLGSHPLKYMCVVWLAPSLEWLLYRPTESHASGETSKLCFESNSDVSILVAVAITAMIGHFIGKPNYW